MQNGTRIPHSCTMVAMPVVHGREAFASAKRDVEGYGRHVLEPCNFQTKALAIVGEWKAASDPARVAVHKTIKRFLPPPLAEKSGMIGHQESIAPFGNIAPTDPLFIAWSNAYCTVRNAKPWAVAVLCVCVCVCTQTDIGLRKKNKLRCWKTKCACVCFPWCSAFCRWCE